jgi:hypothetical protein
MTPIHLVRYGQLILWEYADYYIIQHAQCLLPVVSFSKPRRYVAAVKVGCKCGTSKKAVEYLSNVAKLLTR